MSLKEQQWLSRAKVTTVSPLLHLIFPPCTLPSWWHTTSATQHCCWAHRGHRSSGKWDKVFHLSCGLHTRHLYFNWLIWRRKKISIDLFIYLFNLLLFILFQGYFFFRLSMMSMCCTLRGSDVCQMTHVFISFKYNYCFHTFLLKWTGGLVVSTLGSQPRGPGFESQFGWRRNGFVFLNTVIPAHLTVNKYRSKPRESFPPVCVCVCVCIGYFL